MSHIPSTLLRDLHDLKERFIDITNRLTNGQYAAMHQGPLLPEAGNTGKEATAPKTPPALTGLEVKSPPPTSRVEGNANVGGVSNAETPHPSKQASFATTVSNKCTTRSVTSPVISPEKLKAVIALATKSKDTVSVISKVGIWLRKKIGDGLLTYEALQGCRAVECLKQVQADSTSPEVTVIIAKLFEFLQTVFGTAV